MKHILLLGTGRSASTLIKYLDSHAPKNGWHITVADSDERLLHEKAKASPNIRPLLLNIHQPKERRTAVEAHDLVISLLPADLHDIIAKDCLQYKRHLLTASYVSPAMKTIAEQARKKNLFFLGEMGLDPGLDHLSALLLLDRIRKKGGHITRFHSYAGGLVSKASSDNPWNYKFTWNPRNVALAGQGTAQYLDNGRLVLLPYHRIFREAIPLDIHDSNRYEVYANRDSLKYIAQYGLDGIPSMMRGTIRVRGFCAGWDAIIRLGLTEKESQISAPVGMTWREFTSSLLTDSDLQGVEQACARHLSLDPQGHVMEQLRWLGLFSDTPIGAPGRTPVEYLLDLLQDRWKLQATDRDLVVMEHRIAYTLKGAHLEYRSSLEYTGRDHVYTAMSDLVGLPLAVTAHLFMDGKLPMVTSPVPIDPGIYQPVMQALAQEGVHFEERLVESKPAHT